MANRTLQEWSVAFLEALSKYQSEIGAFSKARAFDTRFGGRSRRPSTPVNTARTKLLTVCDELSSILDVNNKTVILSSLETIKSKVIATNLNQDKIPSYFTDFSTWYNQYIKPLI